IRDFHVTGVQAVLFRSYHALAGEMSPADMLQRLPFNDIDESAIYRYRNGQISPSAAVLNAANEAFRSARSVYEVGPLNVPLWDRSEERRVGNDYGSLGA